MSESEEGVTKFSGIQTFIRCWFRRLIKGNWTDWQEGVFQKWAQDHVEYEEGPGAVPVAIIVSSQTGETHVVYAEWVQFKKPIPEVELT